MVEYVRIDHTTPEHFGGADPDTIRQHLWAARVGEQTLRVVDWYLAMHTLQSMDQIAEAQGLSIERLREILSATDLLVRNSLNKNSVSRKVSTAIFYDNDRNRAG